MSSEEPKKTKTALTNEQRKAIIKHKEKHPQISQTDLVDWVKQTMNLKVHQSTISRLIKNKDEIGENPLAKRQKMVQYLALENTLLEPDTTLATVCLKGKKKDKEWLTVTLCTNASRTDKIMPFVIASKNAWMTNALFQKWLKKFDLKMASRKVILLMDNARCHSVEEDNDDKMNVLTAIKFIVRGWREVSSETIQNCFRHTGIIPGPAKDDDDLMKELYENIEMLNYQNESEQAENDEEDDSVEIPQITHKEALDAINRLELYLMQQNLDDAEHDIALSKLYESVRKFRNASFKQLSIEAFLEPTRN
ncbi:349_t:CDS:2, partial [Dentiscutata erythropus]